MSEYKLDVETRANLRNRIWFSVSELADIAHQKATWSQIDNPHYSFVEFEQCFSDVVHDQPESLVQEGLLSNEEAKTLQRLYSALSNYRPPNGESFADEAILKDMLWQSVVDIAESCRKELKAIVPPMEREHLFENGDISVHRPE